MKAVNYYFKNIYGSKKEKEKERRRRKERGLEKGKRKIFKKAKEEHEEKSE